MTARRPFIFRAHDPLASNNKGFQFKAFNDQERIQDKLDKNVLFETD